MPRSAVPSYAQLEMLVDSLEKKRWLATGHARTSQARDRTRATWQEIAAKLNSDGSGCIKSWQKWSKYWKDKKSAVRKKASQVWMTRQQTDGDAVEEGFLTAIEEKIVAITGGEGFFTGDTKLKNDLIHPSAHEPGLSFNLTPDNPLAIPEASDAESLNIQDVTEDATASPKSFAATSPPAVPHMSNAHAPIASSSPRRRRLATARRRLLRERRSQMASLTERFVTIEERRLENERLLIDNQQKIIDTFKEISESWSRQTQALQDLCAFIRRGS